MSIWGVIAMVAGITFASRIAGPLIMLWVPLSPRLERFLDGLSVSVLAALVASLLAQNDLRTATAVAVASGIMLAAKSAIWAMLAGMACAAAWTWLVA
ncbi:MAG: AzlD domain-containing protein [Rhodospirillaceae bacterium]